MDKHTKSAPVVVAGPLYADTVFSGLTRLPAPGEEVVAEEVGWAPGGYAISALAFHRLEVPTLLTGAVADDFYGQALLKTLEREGLSTSRIHIGSGGHTNVAVALNWNGDRGIVSYGRTPEAPLEWYEDCLGEAGPRAILYLAARHRHAQRLMATASRMGQKVALSLSWNPDFLTSWVLRDLLPGADLLFCNVPEALMVTGEQTPEAAGERLSASVPEVIVTRGPEGASVISEGKRYDSTACPAVVVDATGAGDVFSATYVAARTWGWSVEERLTAANWSAAQAIGHMGGATGSPLKPRLLAAMGR